MLLTDKVTIPDTANDPEDYLYSSLGTIFTDDASVQHGDPGSTVIYTSARFGDIKLSLADPTGESERKLFAHFLWNAGIWIAEAISAEGDDANGAGGGSAEGGWNVKGERCIELGAGLGLGGIVSCLCGAEETVISDYPAPELLNNLQKNVDANIPPRITARPKVQGHEWGVLDDEFSIANKGRFTRVLAADCFWMPHQHLNLVRSMRHFLDPADPEARVYAIAGFHTGRAKLAPFFDVAQEEGFEIEFMHEEDVAGNVREWDRDRVDDVTGRKRWLVIARLRLRR